MGICLEKGRQNEGKDEGKTEDYVSEALNEGTGDRYGQTNKEIIEKVIWWLQNIKNGIMARIQSILERILHTKNNYYLWCSQKKPCLLYTSRCV